MKTKKKLSSLVGRVQDSYTYSQGIKPLYRQSLFPLFEQINGKGCNQ